VHILTSEYSQTPGIQRISGPVPAPTMTLSSQWLRPRLEGYRTAERGKAYDAKLADSARVQFTVRLQAGGDDVLNNFQALLTVEQAPLLGQDPSATFPSFVTDVSGFFAVEGHIMVDVALYGVCRATLTLIRRVNPVSGAGGSPTPMFTLVQVLAEERGLDIQHKLIDRGES
jgi:hypothetical protein